MILDIRVSVEFTVSVILIVTFDVGLEAVILSFMLPYSRLRVLKLKVSRINNNKHRRGANIFVSCLSNPT
jgi:hypothetical protein